MACLILLHLGRLAGSSPAVTVIYNTGSNGFMPVEMSTISGMASRLRWVT